MTGLGELLTDSGAENNPYMMNSSNKKVYQIFIFNNVEILLILPVYNCDIFSYKRMDLNGL